MRARKSVSTAGTAVVAPGTADLLPQAQPGCKHRVSKSYPSCSAWPWLACPGEDYLLQSLSLLSLWGWDLLCPPDDSGEPAAQGQSLLEEGQGC